MKKRLSICSYIISLLWLISCNGQNTHKESGKKSDTLTKEIPLAKMPRYKGEPAYSYELKNELQKELHLSSIETGFDSIYIRSWHMESRTDTIKLFEFWNNKGEWNGKRIFFRDPHLKEIAKMYPDVKIPDSFRIEVSLSPKSSAWNAFTRNLFDLGITELPDDNDVANYPQDADGNGYMFEIATKYKYRLYGFGNPAYYKDEFWQADKVNKIVLLMRSFFNQASNN